MKNNTNYILQQNIKLYFLIILLWISIWCFFEEIIQFLSNKYTIIKKNLILIYLIISLTIINILLKHFKYNFEI